MFHVNTSLLRYWEKTLDFIRPGKSEKGMRQYSEEDVESIRLVYHLVKERGLTLAGAGKKIKENKEDVIQTEEIVRRLKSIRSDLSDLIDEITEMEKCFPGD